VLWFKLFLAYTVLAQQRSCGYLTQQGWCEIALLLPRAMGTTHHTETNSPIIHQMGSKHHWDQI